MIQNDSNIKISNKEVKQFLNKIFGDSIQFCDPMIRDTLMNHTFNLDDKFCDADDPKHSWYQAKIPGEIVEFFSTLFKIANM